MDATVWIAEPPVPVAGADHAIPNVLQTWAAARGITLRLPAEGGRHVMAVDLAVATRVEESLHAARELLTQHDADGAERALAHADALLRAHPELPQAAWLLAEVERGFATRFERLDPVDTARAARHWRAAAALDGGRAPGVGEPTVTSPPNVGFTVDLTGSADDVRLDGVELVLGRHEAPAGLHQLVARSSGEVVFAQWVAITSDTVVHAVLPTPEPCSRADMSGGASHVRCPSWVSVRHAEGLPATAFVVASCSMSACGPEVVVRPFEPFKGLGGGRGHRETDHGLPGWAVWTLTGAGLVAAGVVLGVVGYFVAPPTQQTVFKTTSP